MNKTTKIISGLFISLLLFASCDQLAFDFSQELVKEYIVEITSGSSGIGTFETKEKLNLNDGDLKKHRDKLQDVEVESPESQCRVCYNNRISVLTLPCRHAYLCNSCTLYTINDDSRMNYKKCGICREDIHSFMSFYLS